MVRSTLQQPDVYSRGSRQERRCSVSVCFPAFNEETIVHDVLVEADNLLKSSGLEYEILACDDGSKDATGQILDELCQKIPSLRVFHNAQNMGMRYTFEFLYQKASKDYIFLNATDRQWPTQCIFQLLPLSAKYDIIVASRKNKHYGIYRKFLSRAFNAVPRLLFGVETYDAGAVKLVKREIIERFPLISRSPFSEAERMIRAARAGYRITELRVDIAPRSSGVARGGKPKIILTAMFDIVRVWFDLRQRKIR